MSSRVFIKSGGIWKNNNSGSITPPVPVDSFPAAYTSSNQPTTLATGESLRDNMPAGVPVVNASTYSASTDLAVVLAAVESGISTQCYVYLDNKATYFLNAFQVIGTNDWRGYTNSAITSGGVRKVMGLIGNGVANTEIRVVPNAVNASAGARTAALAAIKPTPVPIIALYLSNTRATGATAATCPLFFSGITFNGTLQTPYGVYTAAAQAAFSTNQTVSSPIAWRGLAVWRGIAGSRMQFCAFNGFAYALNNAPPFENGAYETNYCDGFVVDRVEVDGRIAASIDAARPFASGGIMSNKDIDYTIRNTWLHHTRRSGWTVNTNTNRQDERITILNFQDDHLTTTDAYASSTQGFYGSNIEAFVGIFKYTNVRFSSTLSQHIGLNIPFSGSPGTYVIPDRPLIDLQGFQTVDTAYGGCLRIAVSDKPNGTGISPAWTKLNASGIAGSNLFNIRDFNGNPLVGIKSTVFNTAIHNSAKNFVVIYP